MGTYSEKINVDAEFIRKNASLLSLLKRCGENLGGILSGKEDVRGIMFPGGDFSSVAKVYQETPQSRYYNEILAGAVKALVSALPLDRKIRIIEIGAGTGGTTASILPLLPSNRCSYTFTDISEIFLHRAREAFAGYPFVEYALLNADADTAQQGFEYGAYDMVIAANVLHATPDLKRTVTNIGRLLASGGLLLLREITESAPVLSFDLTFGCLLDELADSNLRGGHPFLSCEAWKTLLEQDGFDRFAAYPDPGDHAFDEHIMLARKSVGSGTEAFQRKDNARAESLGLKSVHPLLGGRIPSPLSAAQYQSEISAEQIPYLAQHKVFNFIVVPGTAHFEIAAAAGLNYFSCEKIEVRDVVLREALMLSDGARTMQVLVNPAENGAEFQIFSRKSSEVNPGGDWHLHVSGNLAPLPDSLSPKKVDIAALRKLCTQEVGVDTYYEKFDTYGAVQYGPAFRGIRRLWRSQGEALAEVSLDRGELPSLGKYSVHPAALDSCLQSMVAALATDQSELTGDGFMPFSVEKVIFYGRAPETVWCHAKMKEGDSFENDMFSANFRVFTEDGELVAEIVNLNMKKTNRQTLEMLKAGQQQAGDLCYDIIWQQALSPDEGKTVEGSWLVFANRDTDFSDSIEKELMKGGRQVVARVTYRKAGDGETYRGMPVLDPADEPALRKAVDAWLSGSGTPAGIIFLWGLDCYEADFEGYGGNAGFKELTGEALLHLAHAVSEHEFKDRLRLALVTCQAQAARPSDNPVPAQSLVWGMEASIASELQSLRPIVIDLDPAAEEKGQAALVCPMITSPDYREDKVAIRGGSLLAPRLVRSRTVGKTAGFDRIERPDAEAFELEFNRNGIDDIRAVPMKRRNPEEDEVEIHADAYGMNFQNVMVAMGFAKHIKTMVLDCAGTVTAVGAAVTAFKPGDRVLTTVYGPFASHVYARVSSVAMMPEGLEPEDAAGIATVFMTSWHALVERACLRKGEIVLLHSATGGIGLAAIQVARAIGADIIATAGTEKKRALLRSMGIRHVFSSRNTEFEHKIKEVTEGRGVDVVLNFLVGELADAGMRSLRPGGRFIEIGKTDLRTPEQVASVRNDIDYMIVDLEKLGQQDRNLLVPIFNGVMKGFTEKRYAPIHRRVFTMDAVGNAFRYMLEGRHIGKVIIKNVFDPVEKGIRSDGTYLITGGFSEIGLALAEHLTEKGAGRLWLIGRHMPADGSDGSAAVSRMIAKGCDVRTASVDVTDRSAMKLFFEENVIGDAMPLRGVFHLAGILDDDPLRKLNWQRFNTVLSPKADGSWFLHEQTRGLNLDHFVVFSSIASVFGTHGQANHVCANMFMDSLVAARSADFLPGLSINWGAWGSIGTVVRLGILDRIRQQGVEGFDTATGLALLDRFMAGNEMRHVVTAMDWNKMFPILQASSAAVMYESMRPKTAVSASVPGARAESGGGKLAQDLRAMPMQQRIEALQAYLKKEIAGFLRLSEGEIPTDSNLTALGMDSLISLDLFQRISRDLKIHIAPHEISANPTVSAMAERFAHDLGPDVEATVQEVKEDAPAKQMPLASFLEPSGKDEGTFPLSDMQQAYWLGRTASSMELSGVACHFYFEAEASGIDAQRYQDAWNVLIRRHGMLRTVILDGETQKTLPEVPKYLITKHDLSGMSEEEREAWLTRYRERMTHEVIDVAQWPNFRIEMSMLGGEKVRLHFSFDLIISDFHGIAILLQELNQVYSGGGNLPDLGLSFREYRLAEERYRTTPAFAKDKAYWLERIDSLPSAPVLPQVPGANTSRPPRFTRRSRRLPADIWRMLKKKGADRGFNSTGVCLAAFAEIIGLWSSEPRFTLNLTLFNRLPVHPDVNKIVGEFTSNSLLEVDLSPGGVFESRAGRLWEQLWQDLEHCSYSGVKLLREMSRRRGMKASLMPVVFTSTLALESSFSPFSMGELGREVYSISQTPQVWIDHQLFEVDGELLIVWDCVDDIFPEGMLDAMYGTYVGLLEKLAGDDSAWTDSHPAVIPAAQAAVRAAVNATESYLPSGSAMPALFLEQAKTNPDRPAVIFEDNEFSYAQIEKRSREVACVLEKSGVLSGRTSTPVVAVCMEKGPEQIAAVLGIQRAGAAYLPIDVHQPAARIKMILESAHACAVLGQKRIESAVCGECTVPFVPVDELPGNEVLFEDKHVEPDDLAYVIYTSGSTGAPKGVMISHRAALNTILDVNSRYSIDAADRTLCISRLGFDLSVYDIYGPLSAGGCVVMPNEDQAMDPGSWPGLIARHGVTVWNTVPAFGELLADELEKKNDSVKSLKLAIFSGDWIPLDLAERLKAKVPGIQVAGMGGATEASIWSNFHMIEGRASGWTSVPYGKPLSNQCFAVLDASMHDRPDWVPGDLYIGGAGLSMGYLGDEELTNAQFVINPLTGQRLYKTGDLARYRPDGVLEFLGRADTQVKIHGYRIELGEIEAAIPSVRSAAVVAARGAGGESRLAAFIEPDYVQHGSFIKSEEEKNGVMDDILAAISESSQVQASVLDKEEFLAAWRELTDVYLAAAYAALEEFGIFREAHFDIESFMRAAAVRERYSKWMRRAVNTLEEKRLIIREGGMFRPGEIIPDLDGSLKRSLVKLSGLGFDEHVCGMYEKIARNLSAILREDLHSGEFYSDDSVPDLYARTLAEGNRLAATIAVAAARNGSGKGHTFRILEVGGGYRTVSRYIIPEIQGLDVHYDFTDISRFFITDAEKAWKDYDFVGYGLLNLDDDPGMMGYREHSYDLIIAGNVLHDVSDIKYTLGNLIRLLRPSGLLLLQEQTKFQLPLELTEGIQQGYESWKDFDLRPLHPLLSREKWTSVLLEQGCSSPVFPITHSSLEETLGLDVLVCEGPASVVCFDFDAVREYLSEKLPEYMIPSIIRTVGHLPLTGNGKIDRKSLAEVLETSERENSGRIAPRNETEKALAAIWQDVLKVDAVGIHENFFMIGGDSLSAFRLLRGIEDAFGKRFSLREIYQAQTVEKQAALILGADRQPAGSLVALNGVDGHCFICFAHPTEGLVTAYARLAEILPEVPFYGIQSRGLDGECEPVSDFAAMVDAYVKDIEKLAKKSPLLLGGWSMGGFIAWEMADRLGNSIGDLPLILLDPPSIDAFMRDYGNRLGDFSALMEQIVPESARLIEVAGMSREIFDALPREEQIRIFAGALFEAGLLPDSEAGGNDAALEAVCHILEVGLANMRALSQCRPRPLARDVVYVKSSGSTGENADFWRNLTLGNFDVVEVSGDHWHLFAEASDAGVVAEKIRGIIGACAGKK